MATARTRLPFNPAVLEWARLRASVAIEEAAAKVGVRPERIMEWEEGEATPTPRQARLLAKHYNRPFLEFFAKKVPEVPEVQLAPDFRFHREPAGQAENRMLREVQSWAEQQRLNAIDLFEVLGESPAKFPESLFFNVNDDVDVSAEYVREYIDFPIDGQINIAPSIKYKLPSIIREKFSSCNVIVLKEGSLSKFRTRGMCLFADPLPIIIYGNESPGAQCFTLAHEFAHILLRQSAISAYPRFGKAGNYSKKVEGWCNRFAAAFLMPRYSIHNILPKPENPDSEISDSTIAFMAETFGVSRQAMLIRLVNLGYVKSQFYWRVKRPQYLQEEKAYEPPPARSAYYGKRYKNKLGEYYTSLVIEAWSSGNISAHNAAEFMGIKKLQHLNDIRKEVSF